MASWLRGKEEIAIIEEENQVGRLALLTHGQPQHRPRCCSRGQNLFLRIAGRFGRWPTWASGLI